MKIQDFINNKHKYKVDSNYQRPAGAWSAQDNACLIDTILKGEPVPIFFINEKNKEDVFYIVDGQQRLNAITEFYENRVKLNKKFSGEENNGKTFNGENPITDDQREQFLNYVLNFHILEDYDDERIRLIFSRLQRGKPLTLGERLNAMPGDIVLCMRELAKHPFMSDSIGVSPERYGTFPDAARMLFYETYGPKDSGTYAIISFFEENPDFSKDSKEFKSALRTLNFLRKAFPENNYSFLSKHAWVFSVYTMVRDMSLSYSLTNQHNLLKDFIQDFHNKIYSEDRRRSNPTYQRFYDNVRGGWSEKIIALRRHLLVKEFLDRYEINEIDEKRQISDEEKIAAFEKNSSCELCNRSFQDYKAAEYHHKIRHTDGGKSELSNIMVLCSSCHDRIHGAEKIDMPTAEDLETEDNLKLF